MTSLEMCAAVAAAVAAAACEARVRYHGRRDRRDREAQQSLTAADIEHLQESIEELNADLLDQERRLQEVRPGGDGNMDVNRGP